MSITPSGPPPAEPTGPPPIEPIGPPPAGPPPADSAEPNARWRRWHSVVVVLTVLLGLGSGVAIAAATSEETAEAEDVTNPRDRTLPSDSVGSGPVATRSTTTSTSTTSSSTTSTARTPPTTLPARATYVVTVTGGPYAECSGTITATLEAGTITLLLVGGGGTATVKPDGTFALSYSNPQVSGAVAGVLDATTLRASAYQFTPEGTECTYVLNGTRSS